jgi:hypothetical protein
LFYGFGTTNYKPQTNKLQATPRSTHLFHFYIFLTKAAAYLSYFYGMQNSLQQLDLFGFPIETPAQPKKKEKAVKTSECPEITGHLLK